MVFAVIVFYNLNSDTYTDDCNVRDKLLWLMLDTLVEANLKEMCSNIKIFFEEA